METQFCSAFHEFFDFCVISQEKRAEIQGWLENFDKQLNQASNMIISFLDTLPIKSKNKIDIFQDEEIDEFQSIAIECYVQGATSVQCIEWTDKIISKIIEIDEKILDVLQIEIIPNE